jgi:hypothetical protein
MDMANVKPRMETQEEEEDEEKGQCATGVKTKI